MSSSVQCPLCASFKLKLLTNQLRFDKRADVYRCLGCDLTFLDQASFKFPKDFYEGDYHQTYLTHVEPDALDPQAYYNKMKKTTEPWAKRIREILTGKEIVLDVGCSTGHLMDLIKDKAAKVYGSELNKEEVEFCRNVLKLDVSDVSLEKRFKEETFDYIVMIFVLEHIAEPVEFLNHLMKFLKPNGKFIILVPNIQDALVNFYEIPEFRKFYYCIEHLYYYNLKTIKQLFDKVGLKGEIKTIQEYPITNHINWAYLRKPSDVLASRKGIPNIPVVDSIPLDDWETLWRKFNQLYQEFLTSHGYGDRIWCVVGKDTKKYYYEKNRNYAIGNREPVSS